MVREAGLMTAFQAQPTAKAGAREPRCTAKGHPILRWPLRLALSDKRYKMQIPVIRGQDQSQKRLGTSWGRIPAR